MAQNGYSDTDNKKIPSTPQTYVTLSEDSSPLQTNSYGTYYPPLEESDMAQTISSEPNTETTARISSLLKPRTLASSSYPWQYGGAADTSSLSPLQTSSTITTAYSHPDYVTTESLMPESSITVSDAYSVSLTTLFPALQDSNKKPAAHSDMDTDIYPTGLPVLQSQTVIPTTDPAQHGISATTFLPPLQTNGITSNTYYNPENNRTPTTSTTLEPNIAESEALTSQITLSPHTLLPPQQGINTKPTAYSDPETDSTSSSLQMSLPNTEVTKSFSDDQDVSAYTSSSLLHSISTISVGYSDPENNTISTTLSTSHSDLENSTSTHS
jgi:hypothetical protein